MLLCSALILLGLLDWVTTVVGVFCLGAVEINPLFAGLAHANVLAFSSIKLSVTVLVGLLFYRTGEVAAVPRNGFQFGNTALNTGYFVSLAMLSMVVVSNIFMFVKII